MAFHHDKSGRAHFGTGGKAGATTPREKEPAHSRPEEKSHAPHGDVGEKHVTETHPGKTQPHPHTGVHAFHTFHTGGGKHESHTHHDGGEVEVRQHPTASDLHEAMHEALPDTEQEDNAERDIRDGGVDFSESLGTGIGGHNSY